MAQVQSKQILKRKIADLSEQQTSVLSETPTKQEQIVQQHQSFAMVQTMLLSSV